MGDGSQWRMESSCSRNKLSTALSLRTKKLSVILKAFRTFFKITSNSQTRLLDFFCFSYHDCVRAAVIETRARSRRADMFFLLQLAEITRFSWKIFEQPHQKHAHVNASESCQYHASLRISALAFWFPQTGRNRLHIGTISDRDFNGECTLTIVAPLANDGLRVMSNTTCLDGGLDGWDALKLLWPGARLGSLADGTGGWYTAIQPAALLAARWGSGTPSLCWSLNKNHQNIFKDNYKV